MKKKISHLAASVLFASSAGAVITTGSATSDSSTIVLLNGDLGFYIYDSGLTSREVLNGQSFSLDISQGLVVVGDLSGYMMFGTLTCDFLSSAKIFQAMQKQGLDSFIQVAQSI